MGLASLGRPLALASLALVILDALLLIWWIVTAVLSSRDYETAAGLKYAAWAGGVVACAAALLWWAARCTGCARSAAI